MQFLRISIAVVIVSCLLQGCTSTVIKSREVTTWDTVYIETPEVVPRYKMLPPEFTFPSERPALITVIPFLSAQENNALSVRVAEEVEYALIKHPSAEKKYKIFDRSRLEQLLRERDLPTESPEGLKEARRLLGVEYLVTGFVQDQNVDRSAFTLKVIDTKDARILFSKKIEGSLTDAAQKAAEVFHEKQVLDRYDTVSVKREMRTRPLTKSYPTEVKQYDPGKTFILIVLIIGAVGSAYLIITGK
jgi:curli biogenesis system outer membrane secretion channel CsgG